MLRRLAAVSLGLAMMVWGHASAQTLPNHVDPSARDVVPNLSTVPALRFLTATDFPPFNYRDSSGDVVGFNVDLARSICAVLNVACTIQAWPWEQAARALADQQGDALIAGLAVSDETAKQFDFSAIYLELPGRFVTSAASASGFDPAALGGQRVAVRAGSTHAEFVARYLPEAVAVPFPSEIAALEAVKAGDVAAYFGDGLRAAFWLNDTPECCAFAGEPYFRPDLFGAGLAIAVPAGHDAVRVALDYGLTRLQQAGTMDELYLRWFPISFY